jgi:hypothetical protein
MDSPDAGFQLIIGGAGMEGLVRETLWAKDLLESLWLFYEEAQV